MMNMEQVLEMMTFEYFGSAKHKVLVENLLTLDDAVLLDVRTIPEVESVQIRLEHHLEVLNIPTNEIPKRLAEIPRNRPVGIFCTGVTRSAFVYAYLRTQGFENVQIAFGGFDAIVKSVVPGKLLKHISMKKS